MNNDELNTTIDNILYQVAEQTVKLNLLTSLTLGMYNETLPKEQYDNLYTNFVDRLESAMNDLFLNSEGIYSNPSFLLKRKFDFFSQLKDMKSNPSYLK